MQRASKFFTDDEKARIEKAVNEAESKTSAEIVPVLATGSGRYDRSEDIIGLWFSVIFMVMAWLIFQCVETPETGDWSFSVTVFELPALIVSAVIGFFAGALAGTYVGWLRRLFSPWKQMKSEVAARARSTFFDYRVHHTGGATGLLIYVSLFERMASIIADQNVIDKLGRETLDELCSTLTKNLKSGNAAKAFCDAIKNAGEKLKEPLPRGDGDVNELSGTLVILD
jgi:putative membrane protein